MDRFRLMMPSFSSLRGKVEYLHGRKPSTSGAFDIKVKSSIKLFLPRALSVLSVSVLFYCDTDKSHKTLSADWYGISSSYDLYVLKLDSFDVGLYFFTLELETAHGRVFGCLNNGSLEFCKNPQGGQSFQISFSDFKGELDEQLYGGVIYHIFVDRFNRGGVVPMKDSAIYVDDWSCGVPEYPEYPGAPLKNNTFYGGTLYGIIEKLPYIASLGTTIIYLSPIFDSVSNHKYDTADYMSVDPMFGGDAALLELVNQAREYGIHIILDGVFNHTGADSIYFNRYNTYDSPGAYQSKTSPYYPWFEFQEFPNKYTSWWGIEILPRINPDVSECREYFVGNGGVIEKYARMGILGFRLDVVDELSDDFVSEIKNVLAREIKRPLLYGEVWEDASNKIAYGKRKRYYLGTELDGVMNYPLRAGIIDYLTTRNTDRLSYALISIINNAPKRIRDMQMNLLGTHDTARILTVLGGESPIGKDNKYLHSKRMSKEERSLATKRLISAYTILATLPGLPAIFYGDEVGLEGYSDPFNRLPFPWGGEDFELLNHYRTIGNIRKNNKVYAMGDFKLLSLNSEYLMFARYISDSVYITLTNNSERLLHYYLDSSFSLVFGDSYNTVLPTSTIIIKAKKSSTISIEF